MTTFRFEAIGTVWVIDIYQEIEASLEVALLAAVRERIDIFDKHYSRFRSDSLVTEMSQKAGVYILPDDAEKMLLLYRDLYNRTNGLMTPLIGNLIADAGYDAVYSFTTKEILSAPPSWSDALEYEYPTLNIKQPVLLDVGAAGKGYLIDLVAEVIQSHDVEEYCIDAGGDILRKATDSNRDALRIGLENPENIEEVIGVYELSSGSICGSAGNRRVWNEFTHIINPDTQTSPKHILGVWVTARTALVADALATALYFVHARELIDGYNFDYLIVHGDGSIEKSAGFAAELF